ncbi:MAG: diaminopimelate epimerase [Planctomycetes bacterium RBG_16_59_8]|nr:MAG: diaminopimelate epimerase [Planctomycetes bacterium RBG_16_59_8]
MKFVKMHGCGNDYVYVNGFRERLRDPARTAVAISDRRTGVGSDGLIIIQPSSSADFRMEMYNADGSEGEMCGNGLRCIGKYVYENGLTKKKSVTVETKGGPVKLRLDAPNGTVRSVTVDMGRPRKIGKNFLAGADGRAIMEKRRIAVGGKSFQGHILSMGNPHCVIFVKDVATIPIERLGRAIEQNKLFPARVNVEFVALKGRCRAIQRTWERGSGETFACGSGACAVGVAAFLTGRAERKLEIELKGGRLLIEYTRAGTVLMTGPAVEVFRGEWMPESPGLR